MTKLTVINGGKNKGSTVETVDTALSVTICFIGGGALQPVMSESIYRSFKDAMATGDSFTLLTDIGELNVVTAAVTYSYCTPLVEAQAVTE